MSAALLELPASAATGSRPPGTFDAHAASYDATFGDHPVARRWRVRVWRTVEQLAAPGTLLDVGAGTGIDALHYASRGRAVVAAEPSPAMRSAIAAKLAARPELAASVAVRELDASADASWAMLRDLEGHVGTLCANFGAVNCLPDLGPLARAARWLVAPGGAIVLVTMPPCCPLELATFWRPRIAWRRLRARPEATVSGARIPIRYHGAGSIARSLAPDFELSRIEPLGLLVPAPPSRALPEGLGGALDAVETALSRVPGLRALGDHVVVTLRRRP